MTTGLNEIDGIKQKIKKKQKETVRQAERKDFKRKPNFHKNNKQSEFLK